ncbi:MAG: virulence RhuM family protein [Muribaculaceae bacterium]|nr:virulence RhuM family protein [Muribaculaceae bacterium]
MNEKVPIPHISSSPDNEIILYQPDETLALQVRVEDDTVWLNQTQIVELFNSSKANISEHLKRIFDSGELLKDATVRKFRTVRQEGTRSVARTIEFFNLDVIISVGYRVNTVRGIQFRQWANKVLKEYLLKGYSVNQRLLYMESRIDHRLSEHDSQIRDLYGKVDFFLKTSLPPREGILFDGQIFDAYTLMCDLVRSATKRIILVDNYVDDSVFRQLDKRAPGVTATIFTTSVNRTLRLDLERHNAQYAPIELKTYKKAHDRFLIIDDAVYHVGASLKDLGKKLFAFSKMEMVSAEEFLNYLNS